MASSHTGRLLQTYQGMNDGQACLWMHPEHVQGQACRRPLRRDVVSSCVRRVRDLGTLDMRHPLSSNVCQLFTVTPSTLSLAGNQRVHPGLSRPQTISQNCSRSGCLVLSEVSLRLRAAPEFSFLDVAPCGAGAVLPLSRPVPRLLSTLAPLQVRSFTSPPPSSSP